MSEAAMEEAGPGQSKLQWRVLIGFLLGAPQLAVDVKKSSITRIDVESFGMNPHGVLRWMLTPKIAGVLTD